MTGIHQDLSETNPPLWDENKGPRGPWGTQREERIVSYGRGWGCRCGDWASGCTQMQRTSDAKVVPLNDLSVPEISTLVHCFCEDGCIAPSLRPVTMSLNLLNCWTITL